MSAAKKTGNFFVWMIIVALVVGLGGFGITNFGGSVQSIGSVGDTPISINSYFTALQRTLRNAEAQTGTRLSLIEAEGLGLVQSARAEVVTQTTLDNELARMGVDIGDEPVRRAVLGVDAFKGPNGEFDRETYRFTLQQNGLSEAEFEEQMRGDTARALLQGALQATSVAPAAYENILSDFFGARRSYVFAPLSEAQLDTPVGAPSETALTAFYEANAGAFTTPESRDITYAWLTPEMLVDSVEIDEDALRNLYEQRITEYVQPERRLVERLLYPDLAAAQLASDRLAAGEVSFEELVEERGLRLSQIDLGDLTELQLGASGPAVFALTEPGVVGPVDTDLGPALIRMNGILSGNEVTFEDASADLRLEMAQDSARRQIADMIVDLDDLLAAGATLEELANDTQLQLGQIDYHAGQDADISAYNAFREVADIARQGDFPELAELEDGGIFALRVNGVTPPRLRPLDEVRAEATESWRVEETARALSEKASALMVLLDAGDAFETLGLATERVEPVTRSGVAPSVLAEPLFALNEGAATVVTDADGTVYLLQMTQSLAPDPEDETLKMLSQAFADQGRTGMAQDLFIYFAQSRLNAAGLTLDDAAIRAVHAQFP